MLTMNPCLIVTTQTVSLLAGSRTNGIKSDEFCEMGKVLTYGLVDEGLKATIDGVKLFGPVACIPDTWKQAARSKIGTVTFPK